MIAPKLRFSEFKDEWIELSLKEYYSKIRNGFVGVATPFYVENGIKYLQGKNIKDGKIDSKGLIYISEDFHHKKNNSQLKQNDILMVQSGHVGECAVVTQDYENANCHALIILSPDHNEKVNSHFVVYYFYSHYGKKRISEIKTGNTIEHVLASEIKEVNLNFPTPKEQTKIAEFLSAVDDKISQLSRQLELLNQYKKGVMQKIFSQEIRFNGFNDEWEGRKIGDFITKYVGGASFTPSDFVKKSNFEVIPKKAITARGLLRLDALNPTFSSEQFYQQNQNYTVDKTYLITTLRDLVPSGPNIGYIVSFENEKKYILAQGVYGFQTKNINRQFLIQYSNTDKFRKIMQSKLVGSTQVHIRNQDYFDTEILVPSIPEQEKIAEFLTAIDERIDHTTAQLTHTKQWKKGLLQQMFV